MLVGVALVTSFTAANLVPSSWVGVSVDPVAAGQLPPTSTISFPSTSTLYGNGTWNGGCASAICGTAHDNTGGSNVLGVTVSVLGPSGHYWNGTDFNTATSEQKLSATGTTSWSLAFPSSNFATAGGGDGTYTVSSYATDTFGNVQPTATSTTFAVDRTAPANALTLVSTSPAGSSFKSGYTIYYRGTGGGSGGSFKLRNIVSDGGSGPASSSTAALGGTATGWSHTPSTVSSPAGGPYDSNTFTWSEGASSTPTEVVTGADAAGNTTAAAALTFTNDSAAPTGGALTVNGVAASGAGSTSSSATGSFTIGTRTDYTDAGSGLATSTLTRQTATLTSSNGIAAGTCGSFGTATTITGSPAQTLTGPSCYQFTLTGTDNVGNTAAVSTTVAVDSTAPSAPVVTLSAPTGNAYLTGTTAYINPQAGKSGGFTATATSTDPDSGIQKLNFPGLTGFSAGGGDHTTTPYATTYTWTGAVAATGSQTVTATNTTGLTATGTFTVTPDTTAPSGAALTVNGVAASGTGSSSSSTTGSFTVGTRTDYTDGGSGLASSILLRQSATLSSTDGMSAGTCGSFGGAVTITGSPAQVLTGPACYLYTLTGTDNVGNTATLWTTVMVDSTAPSAPVVTLSAATGSTYLAGTTAYVNPQAGKSGGFTATATSTDPDTGIQKLNFPALTGFSAGGGDMHTTTPYATAYAWTGAVAATGGQTVTATNTIGLTATGIFTVTPDTTAPSGAALTVNGVAASGAGSTSSSTTGSFAIGARTDYTDGGSGLATSTLTRQTATLTSSNGIAAGTCGSFGTATTITGTPAQTLTGPACYLYTLTGTDNVGNAAAVSTTVIVDSTAPSAPVVTLSAATGNTYLSGTTAYVNPQAGKSGGFTATATSTDPDTGIQKLNFPALTGFTAGGGDDTTSPYATTYTWTGAVAATGSQTVTATNNTGLTATGAFTVTPDTTAPTGDALVVNGTPASGGGSASFDDDHELHDRDAHRLHRQRSRPRLLDAHDRVGDAHGHDLRLAGIGRRLHLADNRGRDDPAVDHGRILLPLHPHRHRQRRQHGEHRDHRRRQRRDREPARRRRRFRLRCHLRLGGRRQRDDPLHLDGHGVLGGGLRRDREPLRHRGPHGRHARLGRRRRGDDPGVHVQLPDTCLGSLGGGGEQHDGEPLLDRRCRQHARLGSRGGRRDRLLERHDLDGAAVGQVVRPARHLDLCPGNDDLGGRDGRNHPQHDDGVGLDGAYESDDEHARRRHSRRGCQPCLGGRRGRRDRHDREPNHMDVRHESDHEHALRRRSHESDDARRHPSDLCGRRRRRDLRLDHRDVVHRTDEPDDQRPARDQLGQRRLGLGGRQVRDDRLHVHHRRDLDRRARPDDRPVAEHRRERVHRYDHRQRLRGHQGSQRIVQRLGRHARRLDLDELDGRRRPARTPSPVPASPSCSVRCPIVLSDGTRNRVSPITRSTPRRS